jgi:HTH-type transcriptional regulator/antitoxin MqsA
MTDFAKCFICGAAMHLVHESDEMSIGSRSAVVEMDRYRCTACGEVFMSPEQADTAQRTLAATLRAEEDLLRPDEIRTIRERRGFTQTQFERLLGVGAKTVVRWERGTVFQNRTTDALIRLIDAVPAALEFLARRNGVTLPQAKSLDVLNVGGSSRTVRFLLPITIGEKRRLDRRGQVTQLYEFHKVKRGQEKRVVVEEETPLPTIPIEAMR